MATPTLAQVNIKKEIKTEIERLIMRFAPMADTHFNPPLDELSEVIFKYYYGYENLSTVSYYYPRIFTKKDINIFKRSDFLSINSWINVIFDKVSQLIENENVERKKENLPLIPTPSKGGGSHKSKKSRKTKKSTKRKRPRKGWQDFIISFYFPFLKDKSKKNKRKSKKSTKRKRTRSKSRNNNNNHK